MKTDKKHGSRQESHPFKNRIPYWIDRRLTGLAGTEYDAIISFEPPFESEDSQYGEYLLRGCVRSLGHVLE